MLKASDRLTEYPKSKVKTGGKWVFLLPSRQFRVYNRALPKTDQKTCIAWTNWLDLVKADLATAQNLAEQLDEACRDKSVVVIVCDSVGQFPGIAELTQG
jgi:hypothetical protein